MEAGYTIIDKTNNSDESLFPQTSSASNCEDLVKACLKFFEEVISIPNINIEPINDPIYQEAIQLVTDSHRTSVSYLQRHLNIGYHRAEGILRDMEAENIIQRFQNNLTNK